MCQSELKSRVPIAELENFCHRVLTGLGVCDADAYVTADVLVTTDTWGVHTHGTKLLKGYARRLKSGGLRVDTAPAIVDQGPAWALVDGNSVLGQVASTFATRLAMQKAATAGVGFVTVRNSCHFGAAGYYAWLAAREGMIGLAMANDTPSVAAPGSKAAVLGSNPLAYAIGGGEGDPILLDMSIATVAGGKVYACQKRGEPIPIGWLVDSEGRPTLSGELFPHKASLSPMGGHKGYGIGLLIEILSAVLSGAAITKQVGSWMHGDLTVPTNHGTAILVINIGAIMEPKNFYRRIADLIQEIHDAPTAEGTSRLMLPGEMEWTRRRHALENGLELPDDVLEALLETASEFGEPFRL